MLTIKNILEDSDLERINIINERFKNDPDMFGYVSSTDRIYGLEFTVNDLGKANNFVWNLIGSSENLKELEDALGITVTCLNYATKDEIVKDLKTRIIEILEGI